MGSRYAMINQDLIIRFESYYQPYLNDIHEGRFDSFEWEGVDSDKSLLWTIFLIQLGKYSMIKLIIF